MAPSSPAFHQIPVLAAQRAQTSPQGSCLGGRSGAYDTKSPKRERSVSINVFTRALSCSLGVNEGSGRIRMRSMSYEMLPGGLFSGDAQLACSVYMSPYGGVSV